VKRLRHPLSIALGVAISLVSLWLAARNIEWDHAANAIRAVNAYELTIAVIFLVSGIFMRAERWRIIISRPLGRNSVQWATAIGFFFNYVYPARAGDVIKIVSLKGSTQLGLTRLGVSAVMDRMIDMLVLLVGLTLLVSTVPSTGAGKTFFHIALAALVVLMFAALSPAGERFVALVERLLGDGRLTTGWRRLGHKAIEGFLTFRAEMADGSRRMRVVGVSSLVIAADYFSIFWLFQAFGWELPLLAPVVVWVVIGMGAALPSAPAGIGIHQLACVIALNIFGIGAADAFAFSIVLQLGSFFAILLVILCLSARQFIRKRPPT